MSPEPFITKSNSYQGFCIKWLLKCDGNGPALTLRGRLLFEPP